MTKLENQCYFGDCRELLPAMAQEGLKAQMCVTSPPYFGLRDYGVNGQIGLEGTPEQYIEHLVEVFRHVRQILSDDGTLWLNIGDSYAGGGNGGGGSFAIDGIRGARLGADKNKALRKNARGAVGTCKPKDLIGIPWMLAFALRADGWYLRQDIIWSKPNPMPESVRDRCTKAHEYLFLLSKSPRYFFDSDALREPAAESSRQRWTQDIEAQAGSDRVPGKTNGPMKAAGGARSSRNSFARATKDTSGQSGQKPQHREDRPDVHYDQVRNKRSVWTVATQSYSGAHFATFPEALVEPCILAGSRAGDMVIDPFFGSGTTGQVAQRLGRKFIGCELNRSYESLQAQRLRQLGLVLHKEATANV
ncbi:DNA-methyltransferase [Chitinimonas koreensis]|uniref:DNA-methyltransferase n=1 Tax=Chitinimonas koreensis TaxID=356302 RepID=UPI001653F2E7|nr:site-specific DNA-methyltransferase [Chitinimonas koreensis]QNM94933.1 site-specific DNA-methyltransferase [Chitinimonas koreensis]